MYLPASAVCPGKETLTDWDCSSPSQPFPYVQERAKTASRSLRGEIQIWPLNKLESGMLVWFITLQTVLLAIGYTYLVF